MQVSGNKDVTRVVKDNKGAIVTASLVIYLAMYVILGLGGIGFSIHPAFAYYHQGPPSASLVSPSDGGMLGSSSVTLEATGDDPDDTDLDITFFLDGSNVGTETVSDETVASHTENGVSDGSHDWYVEVCDQAGDCTTSGTWSFTVDTAPPSTSDNSDDSWHSSSQTITLSCDDRPGSTNAGCDFTEYCADQSDSCDPDTGSTNQLDGSDQDSSTVTVSENGENYVRYKSTDTLGNEETVKSNNVRIDTTNPSNSVDSPSAGSWQTDDFDVGVADSDGVSGLASCDYRVDDGNDGSWDTAWQARTCDSDSSFTVPVGSGVECSSQGSDSCAVQVRATDEAGNTQTDSRVFSIDYTPPSTDINTDDGVWYNESISVDVNDEETVSGFDTCSYRVDDDNDGSYEQGWTARECPDGGFNVSVGGNGLCDTEGTDECHVQTEVNDTAGNSARDDAYFDIDYSAPSVSCDGCDFPDPVKAGEDVTFDPGLSDATSNVSRMQVCEDSGGSPDCTDLYCEDTSDEPDSCSYTTPDDTFETRDYWVRATDEAGNTASPVGPSSFTMKKAEGETCSSDDACLLGECSEDPETGQTACEATVIPEPGIFLSFLQ